MNSNIAETGEEQQDNGPQGDALATLASVRLAARVMQERCAV